jgi:DNA-directed RNA polymerase specialized sigma24 family protein
VKLLAEVVQQFLGWTRTLALMEEDEEWRATVIAAAKGDRKAQTAAIAGLRPGLIIVANRYPAKPQDREDAVQHAFLQLAAKKFAHVGKAMEADPSKPTKSLFNIMSKTISNYLRNLKRRKPIAALQPTDVGEIVGRQSISSLDPQDRKVLRKEIERVLKKMRLTKVERAYIRDILFTPGGDLADVGRFKGHGASSQTFATLAQKHWPERSKSAASMAGQRLRKKFFAELSASNALRGLFGEEVNSARASYFDHKYRPFCEEVGVDVDLYRFAFVRGIIEDVGVDTSVVCDSVLSWIREVISG